MCSLYTDTVSCVRVDVDEGRWFWINSGVRQGCMLAPNVFLAPMDWTMSLTVSNGGLGVRVGDQFITDLDYADDVALLAEMLEVLLTSLDILQCEVSTFGL